MILKDSDASLSYKTSNYSVSNHVVSIFKDFYIDYEGDSSFEEILTSIQDNWFSNKITLINEEYSLGDFILYKRDLKYYYSDVYGEFEISKVVFLKTTKFLNNCINE